MLGNDVGAEELFYEFEAETEMARITMLGALEKHFGPRCEDSLTYCPICNAYNAFDKLFDNPYKE